MKVAALRPQDAGQILEAKEQGIPFDSSRVIYEIGVGEPLSEEALAVAVERVSQLQRQHAPGASFDAEACVALHESLGIDDPTSGNPHFWVWLAVEPFFETVLWRHTNKDGKTNPVNFGIGNRWSNLMARLWYRAELVYDLADSDPYRLARRGRYVDFWESGIIKHRYSSCRPLARAFVTFQYPDDDPDSATLHLTNSMGVRELYKRMRRLQATVAYETLDDATALALIKDLAVGLVPAK